MRTEFIPDYAIHVGQFIKKALDAYGMKQADLSEKTGIPKSVINEIVKGKRNINVAIALKLEPVFEMPADYWMSLQSQFDIAVARAGTTIFEESSEIEIGNKSAIDIAHWFINRAKQNATEDSDYITQLKLQKLLFFAQAESLKVNNKTLFNEPMLHWDYGPVVRSVYDEYKDFNKKPIVDAPSVTFDKETERILERTYAKYGIYTAIYLMELTHNEKSWKDSEKNKALSPLAIKQTYIG